MGGPGSGRKKGGMSLKSAGARKLAGLRGKDIKNGGFSERPTQSKSNALSSMKFQKGLSRMAAKHSNSSPGLKSAKLNIRNNATKAKSSLKTGRKYKESY
jgi:hypothetical protein